MNLLIISVMLVVLALLPYVGASTAWRILIAPNGNDGSAGMVSTRFTGMPDAKESIERDKNFTINH